MDHERLAAELLRALRGPRSQVAFARRLGFSSNVPYTWESGRRFPAASAFLAAASRTGIDVEDALGRFAGAGWVVDDRGPAVRLLAFCVGERTQAEVADAAGIGRQALGRWLRGTAEPRLPDLLRVVGATTRRIPDLIAAFVDPEQVPSIRAAWRHLAAARTLIRSTPWASAVLLCLDLADYRALARHERGWIAQRLGIDVSLEDACVDLLVRAGQVRRSGGRLVPVAAPAVEARGVMPRGDLKRFWGEIALARADDALVSWNLFTVSREDLEALQSLQRDTWRAMRRRVDTSSPSEVLALAHWTLCVLTPGRS